MGIHADLARSLRASAADLPTVDEQGLLPAHAAMLQSHIDQARQIFEGIASTADEVAKHEKPTPPTEESP